MGLKLAIFGAVVAAAGFALGVDGLIYSGGLWLVSGLLIAGILANRDESGSITSALTIQDEGQIGRIEQSGGKPPGTWPGFALMVAIGLGSVAIGLFDIGFAGGEDGYRWVPIVAGILFTLLTLISLPARLGWLEPAALAAKLESAQASKFEADPEGPADSSGRADPKARLEQLEELRRSGLITAEEYEKERTRILGSI